VLEPIVTAAGFELDQLGLELHKPNEDRGTVATGFERLSCAREDAPLASQTLLDAPSKQVGSSRISRSVGRRVVRRAACCGCHPTRGSSPDQVGVAGQTDQQLKERRASGHGEWIWALPPSGGCARA
jgi:hypothetical protein